MKFPGGIMPDTKEAPIGGRKDGNKIRGHPHHFGDGRRPGNGKTSTPKDDQDD